MPPYAGRILPIAIDTSEAPSFRRFTLTGSSPTIEQQRERRARLIDAGQLTTQTLAVIDLRDVGEVPKHTDANAMLAKQRREVSAAAALRLTSHDEVAADG